MKQGTTSPGARAFKRQSTRGLRRGERFEYWRSLFSSVSLDPVERDAASTFAGEMLSLVASDGSTFSLSRYDDTRARFAAPGREFVLLAACVSGAARAAGPKNVEAASAPGTGLVIIDSTHAATTATHNVCQIVATLPRREMVEALSEDASLFENGVMELPDRGVARLLLGHMHMLAREAPRIDAASADVAMKTMRDLTVAAIEQTLDGGGMLHPEGRGEAIIAAARRLIQLRFNEHSLTAAEIAREIGCSRPQLFRVFERHGQSIGDVIRRSRLDHARHLLATEHGLTIEQVAYRCGYTSAAAFTRAFRLDAGVTPLAYRHEGGRSSIPSIIV